MNITPVPQQTSFKSAYLKMGNDYVDLAKRGLRTSKSTVGNNLNWETKMDVLYLQFIRSARFTSQNFAKIFNRGEIALSGKHLERFNDLNVEGKREFLNALLKRGNVEFVGYKLKGGVELFGKNLKPFV